MDFFRHIQENWDALMKAKSAFFLLVILSFSAGFFGARFLDDAQVAAADQNRDLYKDCLATGIQSPQCAAIAANAPKPSLPTKIVTRTLYAPDPNQTAEIARLKARIASLESRQITTPSGAGATSSPVNAAFESMRWVRKWGENKAGDLCVTVDGTALQQYRPTYRLAMIAIRLSSRVDVKDVKIPTISGVFDISGTEIEMCAEKTPEYLAQLVDDDTTHYVVVLVPNGVKLTQFHTFREAVRLGVRILNEMGGPG